MKTITIPPLSSKKENISLLIIVVAILLVAHALIVLTARQEVGQKVLEHQISAYEDLSNVNNSFYTELTNAVVEIRAIHQMDNKFPEISLLEEEGIPPFVKDTIWENRGSLEWRILKRRGNTYYLGISKDANVVGNFLVEFPKNDQEEAKIYYNEEQDDGRALPHTLPHLEEHWKEVLPYTGKEERKKF